MNDAVAEVFAEAARALHPVDGPWHVVEARIAELERQVECLERRLALVARLLSIARARARG
jgi:hypothetical protein